MARVVLYVGDGCHLCEEARARLEELQPSLGFELAVVAIDGDPELERAYRVLLPVVDIDGERAFVFEVDADELRARLG
jgi:glutaredoxin